MRSVGAVSGGNTISARVSDAVLASLDAEAERKFSSRAGVICGILTTWHNERLKEVTENER